MALQRWTLIGLPGIAGLAPRLLVAGPSTLTIESMRSLLVVGALFVPGLLVLALITANLVGQVVVARACRRDRP